MEKEKHSKKNGEQREKQAEATSTDKKTKNDSANKPVKTKDSGKKANKRKKTKDAGKKNKKNIFAMPNIKIGQKYLVAFILSAILFLMVGSIVYVFLSVAGKDIQKIEDESLRANEMAKLASLFQRKDTLMADLIISEHENYVELFEDTSEEFDALIAELEPYMRTEEEKELFKHIKNNDERLNLMLNNIANTILNEHISIDDTLLRRQSTVLLTTTLGYVEDLIEMMQDGQAESVKNANSSLNQTIIILFLAGIIALISGSIFIFLISRNITDNLNNIVETTTNISKGKLNVPEITYRGKDEIGKLAVSVNTMKNNIHSILSKVANASQAVAASSEELTQSANEVKEGSEQVTTTMEDLATGAETQANSASDLSESMNSFVRMVQASEQYGAEVAATSDNVTKATHEGTELMNEAIRQMEQIHTIMSQSVAQVQGLDQQSEEISKLVAVIRDIADQTNLLALNAAIEAARAGEHGQGFAVVADEVRKLAEQVGASVSEITKIVSDIQKETDHVVDSLNSGYKEVQAGSEHISRTGENFASIDKTVRDMVEKINSISANLKNIADNSFSMNNLIEEIASVSEEAAAGVEEAAASTQQTASSMDEVSHNADELAELAEQLNKEIEAFQLK